MKVCEDCKYWLMCKNTSRPCEKWEPNLKKRGWFLGYLDGFEAGELGYDHRRSDVIDRMIEVKNWLSEHENEAREGEREMKEDKYSVVNDNGKVAEHMTLEVAGTLVQALCEKWRNEEVTTIFIAREPVRTEEENIRFEPVKK